MKFLYIPSVLAEGEDRFFMICYKIELNDKVIAHLYSFIDYDAIPRNRFNSKNLIKSIIKETPYFEDVGYAGFRKKAVLRKHIIFGMANNSVKGNPPIFKGLDKERILETIKNVNIKCYKQVPISIRIFLFPTYSSFVKDSMSGVSGFCPWKNTIIIFIHPNANRWRIALKNTFCHEYAHAVIFNYHNQETLLDGIIFDGLAEHFRISLVNGILEPWSKALNKKEAKYILNELKYKLESRSHKLYNEVFYGGGKYPLWTGYSIGFYIVRDYLMNLEKIEWPKIFKKNPEEILKKSCFDT